MNYILEINAFYDWLESNPISASAISLWHALMQINNKCRWCTEFNVAIPTLMAKTGFQRRAIFLARDVLVSKGRLTVAFNGSKKSATYKLIPLVSDFGVKQITIDTNKPGPEQNPLQIEPLECMQEYQKSKNECTDTCTNQVPINKQNKTKQNSNKEPKGSMSSGDDSAKVIRQIFNDFNEICTNLPRAKVLTKRRTRMLGARLHEHGYETINQMLRKAAGSNFLAGANNRKWMASFDWLLGPCNFAKVLEGNYDNNRFMKQEKSGFVGKPSPLELLEEVYNNIQQDGELNH